MATPDLMQTVKRIASSGLGAPLVVVMLLAMVILPLPSFLLDLFFTFNIALSLLVLLAVVYARRPLELAVFPTLLLVATLLRLALNVASTRVVLLEGHSGPDAAGKVIEAFGAFVIGGNYAVGLVVFIILVIINFVVVTKGAGRVSEVSARFTLDSMPGKQMAIDADLNAGLIDQPTAQQRREDVAREADFYGSMDGASKFVRGDAVAGLMIMALNIIGGLSIGMAQHGLDFGSAANIYVMLTIGDGLVAQIPSLLLSTATAIIVTRVSSSEDVGEQIQSQLLNNPQSLGVTAAVIGALGLIPGMPNLVFLLLAGIVGAMAYLVAKRQREGVAAVPGGAGGGAALGAPGGGRGGGPSGGAPGGAGNLPAPADANGEQKELTWDDVQPVDIIGLEVGYRLIPLVDRSQGGQLMNRIKGVRRKLSQELGFLVHSVHIRDNLELAPNAYRITLHGVALGEAEIYPDRELAIDPGKVFGDLAGVKTQDPAFGMDAVWIDPAQRDHAQTLGYTVVDASTVVATHLSELLQAHAHELLGHEEVQQLLDNLGQIAPKLVEDLVPKLLPLSVVLKVLQNLLAEGVTIRDIRTIAETLAEFAPRSQDPAALTAAVRIALSRSIVQQLVGPTEEIAVSVLDPSLERLLQQSLQASGEDGAGFEPGLLERLQQSLTDTIRQQEMNGQESVLLVAAGIRPWMARFAKSSAPGMSVLSYNEIPDNRQVKVVATIGRAEQLT